MPKAKPPVLRMEYTGLRVTDLERSVTFYTKLIGLHVAHQGTMVHGGKFVLLRDRRSGQRLELNWYPKRSKFNVRYVPGEGLDHVGFSTTRSVRAAFNALVARGADVAMAPWKSFQSWIFYVKDPDGNWVEVYGPKE